MTEILGDTSARVHLVASLLGECVDERRMWRGYHATILLKAAEDNDLSALYGTSAQFVIGFLLFAEHHVEIRLSFRPDTHWAEALQEFSKADLVKRNAARQAYAYALKKA
jgi:hypothetical protein